MNILLTGANGFIGRNVSALLAQAGHRIVAASRQTGIDFTRMSDPADWMPRLRGIDAVINSVGIIGETSQQRFMPLHRDAPIALFQACSEAGIRRVIQISALGADDTAFSAYHLSKRAADDALRALDIDWFVLRPSLIYGRGGASAGFFLRLARLPFLPVIGDGAQTLQPVHIADVAATALRCLECTASRRTLDIVGNDSVTFADWLGRMRSAQGLPQASRFEIPPRIAHAAFQVLRHVHPLFQPDILRMLLTGYHGNPTRITDFLGRPPLAYSARLLFADAPEAISWTSH